MAFLSTPSTDTPASQPTTSRNISMSFLTLLVCFAGMFGVANELRPTLPPVVTDQAVTDYVQAQGCVAANVQHGEATAFRCEKPTPGTYRSIQDVRAVLQYEAWAASMAAPTTPAKAQP